MNLLLRLLAVSTSMLLVDQVRAQPSASAAVQLPESYFPGLKTMIESALKQSPRMISRNTDEAIAEGNRIIARAGMLPNIGGSLAYYPIDRQSRADLNGSTNIKKLGYNFSLTQPLFQWGERLNQTRIATLQLKVAQGQTAEAYRLLVNEIRAQYLQLIIKKAALNRTRYFQKIQDEQLALARSKLEKHIIADADMFGPMIYAEQAQLATDRAADDFEGAKRYLAKVSGSPELTDDQIPDSLPVVAPAAAALESRLAAFTAHSDLDTYSLTNLRRQLEIERLNYQVARVRLLPKVSAVLGTSQDQQNYTINNNYKYQVRDNYAGLSLYWMIFDGFANGQYKANTLARRRQLERDYQAQTQEQIASVKTQVRQIEFSARNVAIVERLLESASNAVRVRKDDLARGLASASDVSAAQLGLYETQLNAFNARYDYLMGVAGFLSSILDDPALANLPKQRS